MRSRIWNLIKWFLFQFDAETAHRLTLSMIRLGILLKGAPLRIASGAPSLVKQAGSHSTRVFGLEFLSTVGLAAGFDKDAEILTGLPDLGFGFAEIGTVTPLPQEGNDRPRLFRDPRREAVFNRMGFNGLGAAIVSERLTHARRALPTNFRVGVNVGKNKATPLEDAAKDYVRATERFEGLADYLVMNVSSPNTPGLRSLQSLDALQRIVESVGNLIEKWRSRPPLLLKLAPELEVDELQAIVRAAEQWGLNGFILTNTLGGNWKLASGNELSGGWSGGILTNLAKQRLREVRAVTSLPIISVGGILSIEEAQERLKAGANLVQIYSGWIYRGPSFPARMSKALR